MARRTAQRAFVNGAMTIRHSVQTTYKTSTTLCTGGKNGTHKSQVTSHNTKATTLTTQMSFFHELMNWQIFGGGVNFNSPAVHKSRLHLAMLRPLHQHHFRGFLVSVAFTEWVASDAHQVCAKAPSEAIASNVLVSVRFETQPTWLRVD